MDTIEAIRQTAKFHPVDIGGSISVPGYIWQLLSEIRVGSRALKTGEKLIVCRHKLLQNFRMSGRLRAEIEGCPEAERRINELFATLQGARRQENNSDIADASERDLALAR